MKKAIKQTCILTALILLLAFLSGCISSTPPEELAEGRDEKTELVTLSKPLRKHEELYYSEDEYKNMMDQLLSQAPDTTTPFESVPVYVHDDLFKDLVFSPLGLVWNTDALSFLSTNIKFVLNALPEMVSRKCSPDRMYWVCDTDAGYRVFFGTDGTSQKRFHPLVLKKGADLLSYEDFRSLNIGDPFENVCAVDPAAECYGEIFKLYRDYPDMYFRETSTAPDRAAYTISRTAYSLLSMK